MSGAPDEQVSPTAATGRLGVTHVDAGGPRGSTLALPALRHRADRDEALRWLRVRVAGDAVYDQDRWLPQIAFGLQYKRNDDMAVPTALGARHAEGVDFYVAATKVWLGAAAGRNVLLNGTLLGQKVTPLDRAGIYVPGGKAAYPSSLLMNAIPAHVAGVAEIIMVVPTPVRGSIATGGQGGDGAAQGERNPLVLAAAYVAGVTRAFTIGGAQAVGALAYGTATVPKVDKITGPGNAWVAACGPWD